MYSCIPYLGPRSEMYDYGTIPSKGFSSIVNVTSQAMQNVVPERLGSMSRDCAFKL
jgi:hypothetical protein